MQRTLPLHASAGFTWILLVDPTAEEAEAFGQQYGVHPEAVRDFLLHPHLPKFEAIEDQEILLVRAYDEVAKRGDTYQALSRRLLTILAPGLVVTVVRREQPFLQALIPHLQTMPQLSPIGLTLRLVGAALLTFADPLKECEERLDTLETTLFARKTPPMALKQVYGIKRRCSVTKRLLWRSQAMLRHLGQAHPEAMGLLSDLKEDTDRLHAWAEELLENATQLANLEVNLASQRTSEVMRVLTVFSAFFLPLTFIAGVYGMNFHRMPGLNHPAGFALSIASMVGTTLAIWVWFKRRGWLR